MLDYIRSYWNILSQLPNIEAYIYAPWLSPAKPLLPKVTNIGFWGAHLRCFEIVFLADHAPSEFDPHAARIMVPHGPVRSRPFAGSSYYYERSRMHWLNGKPVYDLIFDSSLEGARELLDAHPEYSARIFLTGDLRTSFLVDNAARTSATSDNQIIAVLSTWGPEGLFERYGEALFPEIEAISQKGIYKFRISVHPNICAGRGTSRDWVKELKRLESLPNIEVMWPGSNWESYLADATAAITDHTSLSASFAATGKPLIPFQVNDCAIGADTFFDRLCKSVHPLQDPKDLLYVMEARIRNHNPAQAIKIVEPYLGDTTHALQNTVRILRTFLKRQRAD